MKKLLTKLTFVVAALFAIGTTSTVFAESVTDRYDDTFRKYSQRFFGPGYDWRIFKAQAMAESNIDMNAKSWVGARGIMQLMPSTFSEIKSKNPEMVSINKPEWNIAAGIYYDRQLWKQWTDQQGEGESVPFVMSSYNAGRGTLLRAQGVAKKKTLDPVVWLSIETVAPEVPRWREEETLTYVRRIRENLGRMDENGRVVK
jgi:Predicted soluble lytic transglycosylase fused to an ABC-type amino acid-binding protein